MNSLSGLCLHITITWFFKFRCTVLTYYYGSWGLGTSALPYSPYIHHIYICICIFTYVYLCVCMYIYIYKICNNCSIWKHSIIYAFFLRFWNFKFVFYNWLIFACLHLGSLLLGDVCYPQSCYFFISMLQQQVSLCSHSGAGNNCLLSSLNSSPIFIKAFTFHILFFSFMWHFFNYVF